MHVDFGSCLDHFSNEMYQMNTKIRRITCCQSRLGGFAPSPSPDPSEESFDGGEYESDDSFVLVLLMMTR